MGFSAAAWLAGFLLGGGLIVAIGAQNAYVIRQGVIGQHTFAVCLFCALSDAVLIVAGVLGLGALLKAAPFLIPMLTYGGAAFLVWYGVKALRRALQPQSLAESGGAASQDAPTLTSALLACAAFTFLNPHVYLDTVVLVGSIAQARPAADRTSFALGAISASFAWFFSLGYAAHRMRAWLSQPTVWRALDLLIAMVMFTIAFKLLTAPIAVL
jgi:L-lysine exporter family protein LysE/ArgO